ncbi:flagellar basal-body MS-ring/collar protein FliF [Sphingomonas flavalba]|uniref:flagellar basal-body MS-ring/collar protein FliF n=1 Tax=Sphingomonas flavalba TaxID=2559804 RepID=UPI0039E18085
MATNALSPAGEILPAAEPALPGKAPRNPMAMAQDFLAQPAVRKSIPAVTALLLAAVAALAWAMLSTPPQKVLFSGLPDADKGAVAEALSKGNIANRIDAATGTLTVAEDDYYRARMLLAAQDLPKAAPGGYAILDQLPMGVSRAVEGERLRQARETELARSIQEIESVTDARVHLAMPESSVFVRDNAAPSASVIVRLAAGRSLGDAQVRSIVNLVASSVPGMKPEAVTIVDGTGQLLSKPGGGVDAATAGDQRIDMERRVEGKYRTQLVQLLTPLVGAGNFSAEVQAELNLDETQATRETYDKDGVLRAEQGNWTGNQAEPAVPQGIPGALSNTAPPASEVKSAEKAPQPPVVGTPGAPGVAAPAQAGAVRMPDNLKQSDQYARSYELGKEVSVTRATPGTVRRLSVAVVLREPEGGKPRSAQEIRQIDSLVRAAVGFDAARNDQITVLSRKFATGGADADAAPWYEAGWVPVVARNLTALVIALLVLLFGVRPLVKAVLKKKDAGTAPFAAEGAPAIAGITREPVSIEMLDSARSYDDKVNLVRDFTRDNPARAALAVRDMIQTDAKAGA